MGGGGGGGGVSFAQIRPKPNYSRTPVQQTKGGTQRREFQCGKALHTAKKNT